MQEEVGVSSSPCGENSGYKALGKALQSVSVGSREFHAMYLHNIPALCGSMSLVDEQDVLTARYVDYQSSHSDHDADSVSDCDSEDSIEIHKRRLARRPRRNIRNKNPVSE